MFDLFGGADWNRDLFSANSIVEGDGIMGSAELFVVFVRDLLHGLVFRFVRHDPKRIYF